MMLCKWSVPSVLGGLLLVGFASAQVPQSPKGLWLLPRKDACNTARADVPGDMKTAPKEVWRYGGGVDSYVFLAPVRVSGEEVYFAQVRSGVQLVRPDGATVWNK